MLLTEIDTIIYPESPVRYTALHAGNNIELRIDGWDEPNYGRTLNVVTLLVNNADQTGKYFNGWNRTYDQLGKYVFTDSQNRYSFIPAERQCFLIDNATLEKIELGNSIDYFIGNFFYRNWHIVVTRKQLIITNVEIRTTNQVLLDGERQVGWCYFLDDKTLKIIHFAANSCSLFDMDSMAIVKTEPLLKGKEFEDCFTVIVWSHICDGNRNILAIEWVGKKDPIKDRKKFILEEDIL